MKEEPEIIINGQNIGPGCALTIRVAIEVFAEDLIDNGLGKDEHAKKMVKLYIERINDIRKSMGLIK